MAEPETHDAGSAIHALPPVHFAELPNAAALNRPLIEAFEREKQGPEVRRTHAFDGRFENTYIAAERLPPLQPVCEFVVRCASRILGRSTLRHGFWFNEMLPGQRTTLHSHEEDDELLSAVYYLDCQPASGRLLLHDSPAQIAIEPRPGLLVLFSPDLPHEVEPNHSEHRRLSIAFNFGPSPAA